MSASSDGTIKIWDSKTTDCIHTIRPGVELGKTSLLSPGVHTLQAMPGSPELVLVCNRSPKAYLVNGVGQTIRIYHSGKVSGGEFVAAAFSSQGKYLIQDFIVVV